MPIPCLISVHIILSDWKLIEQLILCDTWSWYLCVCRNVCPCTGTQQTPEPCAGSSWSWNPIYVGAVSLLQDGQQWKELTGLSAIIFSSWGSKVSPFSTAGQDCSILGAGCVNFG